MTKKFAFKPAKELVVVPVPEISETTESGIIKTEAMIEKERRKQDLSFTIIAIGDDVEDYSVGDVVFLRSINSQPVIMMEEKLYLVVHQSNLLGKKL